MELQLGAYAPRKIIGGARITAKVARYLVRKGQNILPPTDGIALRIGN